MWALFRALDKGWSIEQIHELTKIDPWFLEQFAELVELRRTAEMIGLRDMSTDLLRTLKRAGFGDQELGPHPRVGRSRRCASGGSSCSLVPAFKRIDTCAAEFESFTPYLYSSYEETCEAEPTDKPKIVILGSGPNRIGQGIEFDYCCCHAVFGFRAEGFETVMINCNPETVSTDYDTADRLYFEPLTFEDVMAVIEREREGNPDVVVRRAVRRADAAQAGAGAAGGGRQDSRHLARLDRPRGGSAALCAAAVGPRHPAAGERHGDVAQRSARGRRRRSASRSSCGRRTCSAAATWPSSTTSARSIATWRRRWTCRTIGRS